MRVALRIGSCGIAIMLAVGTAATAAASAPTPPAPATQPSPPASPENAVAAVWAPRELKFMFLGFTAKYSCDGLQTRVRAALLRLGARPDLEVRTGACAQPFGRPTEFPNVIIKMNVLVPATDKTDTAAPVVAAHWQRVNLAAARDVVMEAGDCEIIEQIKSGILPQFTTRDVDYQSTCVPHQLTVGGTQLRADVLVADPVAATAAAH